MHTSFINCKIEEKGGKDNSQFVIGRWEKPTY